MAAAVSASGAQGAGAESQSHGVLADLRESPSVVSQRISAKTVCLIAHDARGI